ncbi:MAG: cytidylyltransferase domain-containing protein [Candidatus Thorarchaeota archaeon]
MKIFIPVKANSTRLRNKNFLWIGKRAMWRRAIDKFHKSPVYVDTDSEALLDKARGLKNKNLVVYRRDKSLVGDEVPVNDLIAHFLDNHVKDMDEIIVQTHVTSPFVTEEQIMSAAKMIKRDIDSAFSVTERRVRLWQDGLPLNEHSPYDLIQTQSLKPVAEENSAFYIFTKRSFQEAQSRIGLRPYLYPLDFPYGLDIDTKEDWDLCRVVHRMLNPVLKKSY